MNGHIRRRGSNSWELKFDLGRDPRTGKRETRYHSYKGTKREAQLKLAELIAAMGKGAYVEPSKITVADFVRDRLEQWEEAGDVSARTAQRYRQLLGNQIAPYLGAKLLQKLKPLDIEQWHTTLKNQGRVRGNGGVAARTIGHAHKILNKALRDAAKNDLVTRIATKVQPAPKVVENEIIIVRNVPGFIVKLEGARLYMLAMIALFTGMRLSEILALCWNRVHLDRKVIEVRAALEQTKAHGIRLKAPKSKAGNRDITMPDILVDALHAYRKATLELRMQLGIGKLSDDALLFTNVEGKPLPPDATSTLWAKFAKRIGVPEVTFHALRHTHASQLIDQGVDVVTIAKRLGHAKPDITLRVYAHLFRNDDSKAAAAINAAFK